MNTRNAASLALKAQITARSEHPRAYRIVNGLGHAYRADATSCLEAMRDIGTQLRMPVNAGMVEVLENGTWVKVI